MKPRVIIFDVYGTLLEVMPPPAEAEVLWQSLYHRTFGKPPPRPWSEHRMLLREVVIQERSASQNRGVPVPEVVWEEVVASVIPECRGLSRAVRDGFLVEQAGLTHTLRLFPEVASLLPRLRREGVRLGIASNAQAYSEAELDRELAASGLSRELFESDLCFWSWRHGFSKPDPHVFCVLDARIRQLGFRSGEALMVGDRLDNDVRTARAWGWETWHLGREAGLSGDRGGDWGAFRAWWEGL